MTGTVGFILSMITCFFFDEHEKFDWNAYKEKEKVEELEAGKSINDVDAPEEKTLKN